MPLRIAIALISLGVFSTGAVGEGSPTEFEKLKADYESYLIRIDQSLDELGAQYRKAVRNLHDSSRDRTDLDGAVATKEELERYDEEELPPSDISSHPKLARLQTIYRSGYGDAVLENRKRRASAEADYRKALESLARRLTTEGKLEEALVVKNVVRELEDTANLKNGLVLYLRFEGVTEKIIPDLSGKGNDGHLVGRAVVRRTKGIRESFVSLDYPGDFIRCAHGESLSLTTDGTISIWIRPRELRDLRGLVCKYTPQNSYTFRVSNRSGSSPRVIFGDYGNTNICKSEIVIRRWTHLVVTLADNLVSFYIDGELDAAAERPKKKPLATNTNPLRIGSDYDGRYFHGDVDDIRIYRRALTADEVTALFESES